MNITNEIAAYRQHLLQNWIWATQNSSTENVLGQKMNKTKYSLSGQISYIKYQYV